MRWLAWSTMGTAGVVTPAMAETLASGSAVEVSWLRLLLALSFCLALALAGTLVLRRHKSRRWTELLRKLRTSGHAAQGKTIRIFETRRASQHADLCALEFGGRVYLVAFTAGGATVLDRRSADSAQPLAGDET